MTYTKEQLTEIRGLHRAWHNGEEGGKRANLRSADLRSADLSPVRADFISEVLNMPSELEFLRDALLAGKVNGSTYDDGECGCLAGTLAHARGIKEYAGQQITNGRVFTADSSSPREVFFLAIRKGDTPETNGACKIALDWTEEAIAIRDNIRAIEAACKDMVATVAEETGIAPLMGNP